MANHFSSAFRICSHVGKNSSNLKLENHFEIFLLRIATFLFEEVEQKKTFLDTIELNIFEKPTTPSLLHLQNWA